jgi:rhamnosyl/mannosyltransferase
MESHLQTLALAQAEAGHQVEAFCINHQPGPTRIDHDGPVRVVRFARFARFAKLDLCRGLTAALRQVKADLIHVHVPNPTMLLALTLARTGLPLVVTYHSDHVALPIRGLLFRPVEKLVYSRVRAILTTSPYYAAGSPFLRSYADRIHVLPLGIDPLPYTRPGDEDRTEAERIRARLASPLWLACGRLIWYKGLIHAIRALPMVPGTLLIVGDGPDRAMLEAEANQLGIADRVVFAGNVPRVAPYFLAAYAFWFPSNARSEAFGLVQLEAMASGCPVINTAIPHSGVSWVSRHEETGLTVPMNDPAALAAAANRLLLEPELRHRLGEAGQRRVLEEFDHRLMARRSIEIYRRVLS